MIARGRPKLGKDQKHIGFVLSSQLYDGLKRLASVNEVSINYVIRRAVTELVSRGTLPMAGTATGTTTGMTTITTIEKAKETRAEDILALQEQFDRLTAALGKLAGKSKTLTYDEPETKATGTDRRTVSNRAQ